MLITLEPSVLRWARERASLDENQLATKIGISVERIYKWEIDGELKIAWAEKISKNCHVPFGFLFLGSPPEEKLSIPDFRTLDDNVVRRPSPEMIDVIDLTLQRQEWYRQYLVSAGEIGIKFIGTLSCDFPPIKAAERIRTEIGIDTRLRSGVKTWEEALRLQIEKIEECGVLVMRSSIVGSNTHRPLSVKEFRGFTICDEYAPVIFINGRDAKAAQVFTLMHELVHLWLGVSGVSNFDKTYSTSQDTERYCNKVAAEILVPEAELKKVMSSVTNIPASIAMLTREFKVSSLVILRRLKDIDLLTSSEFRVLFDNELDRFKKMGTKSKGGGDYYVTQRSRSGVRFAKALIESTFEGRTPFREALHLFGMSKIETLKEFARELKFAL